MNAIRKKDGFFMRLSDVVYDQDGTEYKWDEVDLVLKGRLQNEIGDTDWGIVRNQAAIAAMQGFITNGIDTESVPKDAEKARKWVARSCVLMADALVEELKKNSVCI